MFSDLLVRTAFLIAAILFILGIKRMASPLSARSGIQWAGIGMLLATAASFFYTDSDGQGLHNLPLILLALGIGTVAAWVSGKRVAMTDMPQMVALYNGMGGGSAAAIGLVELLRFSAQSQSPPKAAVVFAVVGALIGWLASLVMKTDGQQGAIANILIGIAGAALGRRRPAANGGESTVSDRQQNIAPRAKKEEWLWLAGGDEKLRGGLERLGQ